MAEEVEQEVEAMEAMYGSDCRVFQHFPPHLSFAVKPRTADDLSVQFVEAVLVIKANEQYPVVPPDMEFKDVKGLDDKRHAKLLADLNAKASELSGGPMLVAICEAATDLLTNMNVPEGNCCFCMDPLVMDDGAQPFMKLMSCFHCFHSDCFGEWWRWLQQQSSPKPSSYSSRSEEEDGVVQRPESPRRRNLAVIQEEPVHCPVCRMAINPEDVAHVRDYITAKRVLAPLEKEDDVKVAASMLTEAELARRARFSAEFEAQQARGGIIENRKLEVIRPGMVAPPRLPALESTTLVHGQVPHQGQDADSTDSKSGSLITPYASSSTTTTQELVRRQGNNTGHSRLHAIGRGGRSYRGNWAGKLQKGRRGGGYGVSKRYQEGPGFRIDLGTNDRSRVQPQDARHVDGVVVHKMDHRTTEFQ